MASTQYPGMQYQYANFDVPGAKVTHPTDINNGNEIVGSYLDSTGVYRGFIYTNDQFLNIDAQCALQTYVNGVNNEGDIVGSYCYQKDPTQSLLGYDGFGIVGGKYLTVSVPGSLKTDLADINDNDQAVGTYVDCNGNNQVFIYENGNIDRVNIPAEFGTSALATGIDNNCDIIGTVSATDGVTMGFIYNINTGQGHTFSYQGDSSLPIVATNPEGINDSGMIVGYSVDTAGDSHAFMDTLNGQTDSFMSPELPDIVQNTYPYGISDTVAICGHYMDISNQEHGVLVTLTTGG